MSGTLVIAETRRGQLRGVSLQLISCARQLADSGGEHVTVAVIDPDPGAYTDALSTEGVDEVLKVQSPRADYDAGLHRAAVKRLVEDVEPDLVLIGHSVDGMGYAPALAAEMNMGLASDVLSVDLESGELAAERAAYGDRLLARVEFPGSDGVFLMIRDGAYEPSAAGGGSAEVADSGIELDEALATCQHLGFIESDSGEVDISEADFLLAIGRGIEEEDNLPQFEELASSMGATLAVSRPLVDAGWVHVSRQVGQSGTTVKPRLYLALGISGAVQHLAGLRAAQTIVAINTDPEAPIFGIARYGAVADLFDVADELSNRFS